MVHWAAVCCCSICGMRLTASADIQLCVTCLRLHVPRVHIGRLGKVTGSSCRVQHPSIHPSTTPPCCLSCACALCLPVTVYVLIRDVTFLPYLSRLIVNKRLPVKFIHRCISVQYWTAGPADTAIWNNSMIFTKFGICYMISDSATTASEPSRSFLTKWFVYDCSNTDQKQFKANW